MTDAAPLTGEQIEDIGNHVRRVARDALLGAHKTNPAGDTGSFLRDVAGLWGGTVEVSPYMSWEEAGSLVVEPGGESFRILLSPITSPLRDNFGIAHDLGHFFLHYLYSRGKQAVFPRHGSGVGEVQANRFAAALLMPADQFHKARLRHNDDAIAIAGQFGVPAAAVETRMEYVQ